MNVPFSVHSAPAQLTVTSIRRGDTMVVAPVGEVDSATTPALEEALRAVREPVLVDLSSVEFLSCAGIRALLVAYERMPSLTVFLGSAPGVRRCVELSGAADLLPVRESLDRTMLTP
ncbi:STAS domain-containing protein [Amycolatopsis ultiminotia]|uniref:STAS domain-containing protein n=1 Tax=Amycolatopsis ultiminotia TaxID=543629 RepID=A0ABP6UWP4_9PSEU